MSNKDKNCSIEIEKGVLGCVLLKPNTVIDSVPQLKREHFFEPLHGVIYNFSTQVAGLYDSISAPLLSSKIPDVKIFDQIGGFDYYIEHLRKNAPCTSFYRGYAETLIDLFLRREVAALSKKIESDLEEKDSSGLLLKGSDVLSGIEEKIFKISDLSSQNTHIRLVKETLRDLQDKVSDMYHGNRKTSEVETGFTDVDRIVGGLFPTNLVVVAARPAMGKTSLAISIATNVGRTNKSVGFFSLEMSAEEICTRIVANHLRIPPNAIRNSRINEKGFQAFKKETSQLFSMPIVLDDTGGLTMENIIVRSRRMKRQYNVSVIIIDYLQLINAGRWHKSRVEEVSNISYKLKTLAKELDIPIIALSQLSRQVESREGNVPLLSDLRESGAIEQDSDVVLFIYRESYYIQRKRPKGHYYSSESTELNASDQELIDKWKHERARAKDKARIIIAKNRHGPTGEVDVRYNEDIALFSNKPVREDMHLLKNEGGY